MEIKGDLHNYIICFDNVLPKEIFFNFKKICKEYIKYQDALVVDNNSHKIDKKVRQTSMWNLTPVGVNSLTQVHWANFMFNTFNIFIKEYMKKIGCDELFQVNNIQVLKYGLWCHYVFHTDYCKSIPRAFSCIFLINDDYEGGDLIFKYPHSEKKTKIDKRENRMIIWPSNFLYPHSVLPVTKGERYSVVAWAL